MVEQNDSSKAGNVRRPAPGQPNVRGPIAHRLTAFAPSRIADKREKLPDMGATAIDCLIVFNAAVALSASLMLAASGRWMALGFELLDVIVAPFLFLVFALALTPAMWAISARQQALAQGKRLAAYLGYWGMHGWTALVVWSWCILSFRALPHDFTNGIPWPSLLFAYSMAALPVQWLLRGPWEGEASLRSRLLRRLIRARVRIGRL